MNMNQKETMKLYNSLTAVNEKYIEEAQYDTPASKKIRRPMLIVACFVFILALCAFDYAISAYWGVGSAGDISFDSLTKPFGTINIDNGSVTDVDSNAWKKSDLITDYTNIFADNSIYYALDNNDIPPLYFSPAFMIIFANEAESGWTLNAGEEMVLELSLNDKQSVELEFGYVLNGQYYELSNVKGHNFSEKFKAPENGEYYFCVTNHSSINAVIIKGAIGKK